MKLEYHWAHSQSSTLVGQCSSSFIPIPEQVWKTIWKLNTPPRIQSFMWKTFHRALATMVDLFKRRSSPSPTCPICHNNDELMEHLFLLCPWVENIWFGMVLNYKLNRDDILTWAQWLHSLIKYDFRTNQDRGWLLFHVAFACWHI